VTKIITKTWRSNMRKWLRSFQLYWINIMPQNKQIEQKMNEHVQQLNEKADKEIEKINSEEMMKRLQQRISLLDGARTRIDMIPN
jgi:hypothetical protein